MWRVGPDFKPLTQVLIEFYSTPCANIMTKPGSSIMSSVICWFSHDMTTTACFPEKVMKYSFVKQLLWFCWSRLIWRTQFVTFFMSVCLSVYTSAFYGCWGYEVMSFSCQSCRLSSFWQSTSQSDLKISKHNICNMTNMNTKKDCHSLINQNCYFKIWYLPHDKRKC